MSELRNPWKLVLAIVVLLVAAQAAVSLTARTRPFHNYLSAHLEKAFGRPVQVRHFNIEILPSPRIYATGVTVGENPAFGYEYFLHAEHLTAGLRWSGFLRGHFEFGTLSLSQSSLTLVRNREGRWNLEDWLPQARKSAENGSPAYGPSRPPTIANRLERIEIEDGRINFKSGDMKQPFALTGVTGSVEQLSPGRWKVQLNAQPWRSGVTLQSTGTIEVAGDIAGTSARLQPASLSVRWDTISLADLFRLLRGRDYGVRGNLTLQGTAKSGAPSSGAGQGPSNDSFASGDWSFSLKASANGIHRWDLTERADNPKLNASVQGRWNIALGTLIAENLQVETTVSNLHGIAHFRGAGDPFMEVKFDSAQVQAADVLSWCRAFQPDLAEGITADEFFRGSLAFQGWPIKLLAADLSTAGGMVNVRGVDETLKFGSTRAVVDQNRLVVSPVRIALLNASPSTSTPLSRAAKRRPSDEIGGELRLTMSHDFSSREGAMGLQGHIDKSENALKLAAAFGHMLNHGWDLTGPARADLRLQWSPGALPVWNGVAEVNGAELAAAGLNQPLQLQQVRLEFRNGRRSAQITQAVGFGATWSGNVTENNDSDDPELAGVWNVDLHADHLDATELDRWVGPRARPGWLQKLLPSLLGGTNKTSVASELVRRLNVIGNVQVDAFSIEKLKLQQVHLQGSLHDLRLNISDGRAQWAGGNVRATMTATFLPQPRYDVRAQLDGIQLAQLPLNSSASDRLGGAGSGTLHLRTAGVGRDELLQKLSGAGEVHLTDLEFRGWDVNATVADGESHPGISRWPTGDGTFSVRDRTVILDDMRLDGGSQFTWVNGAVSFSREANLSVETSAGRRAVRNTNAPGHVLKIVGPLDDPTVSRQANVPRQPAD